jgi:hypothetical protein
MSNKRALSPIGETNGLAPRETDVARSAFQKNRYGCGSACKKGSDSHLMIFDVDVVLFSKGNQCHGRSFAFIFVGAVRIDR